MSFKLTLTSKQKLQDAFITLSLILNALASNFCFKIINILSFPKLLLLLYLYLNIIFVMFSYDMKVAWNNQIKVSNIK